MTSPKARLFTGLSIGLITGIPWLGVSFAGWLLAGLPLVPVSLFESLSRLLPGGIVTDGIDLMVQALQALRLGPTAALGKQTEFALAYLLTLVSLTLLGGLYALILSPARLAWSFKAVISGLLLSLAAILATGRSGWGQAGPPLGIFWLLAINLAWNAILAWGVENSLRALATPEQTGRRRFFAELLVGSIAVAGVAVGFARWLRTQSGREEAASTGPTNPTVASKTLPGATSIPGKMPSAFTPVEGTRPELTPISDFYRVDINLLPPDLSQYKSEVDSLAKRLLAQGGDFDIQIADYALAVTGLVEKSLILSLADLKTFQKVQQYATLECISNPVGGDLISSTLFEGVQLKAVLNAAGLKPEAVDIKITGVDGYTESLPIESALDEHTLLVYAMGGQPLTREHGAPLRLYTPNRFGMKNPKWIIQIEAVNSDYKGFWEQRGWSEDAWVKTTSAIDTVQKIGTGQVEAGGIAFSGARGIQRVEVRVDEGEWLPAELKNPVSPLTWALWRVSLDVTSGKHILTVRSTDGGGDLQTGEKASTHPDGASGYDTYSFTV